MRAAQLPATNIKQHVENLLVTAGHRVADIHRIYSPGDLGSSDSEATTVLFSDPQGVARTALVWREQNSKKHPLAPPYVERVRVLTGWD